MLSTTNLLYKNQWHMMPLTGRKTAQPHAIHHAALINLDALSNNEPAMGFICTRVHQTCQPSHDRYACQQGKLAYNQSAQLAVVLSNHVSTTKTKHLCANQTTQSQQKSTEVESGILLTATQAGIWW